MNEKPHTTRIKKAMRTAKQDKHKIIPLKIKTEGQLWIPHYTGSKKAAKCKAAAELNNSFYTESMEIT